MEPLRARRQPHPPASAPSYPPHPPTVDPFHRDSSPASTATATTTTTPKPTPLSTRPRKPSLSLDRDLKARPPHRSPWATLGGGLDLDRGESRVILGLTLLGAVLRYWKIGRPSSVVCVLRLARRVSRSNRLRTTRGR